MSQCLSWCPCGGHTCPSTHMEVTHVMVPIWRSCRSWFLCGIGWALSCQSLIKTCPTDLPPAGLMEAFSPWRLLPLILQLVSSWHKSRQHKDITRFTPTILSNMRKLPWYSPITGYRENDPCLPRALSTQPSTFIHLLSSYREPATSSCCARSIPDAVSAESGHRRESF